LVPSSRTHPDGPRQTVGCGAMQRTRYKADVRNPPKCEGGMGKQMF
jgi:hypothetical protein